MEDNSDILLALLDNITDCVAVVDASHKLLYLNELAKATVQTIHGNSISVGQNYLDCVPALYREGYIHSFNVALNGEKVVTERQMELYDGTRAWYRFQLSPIRNSSSTIWGVMIILTDIHDRKIKEAALDDSEIRFRHAFEHSFLAMALVSVDGMWLKVNNTLCDIVGYKQDELIGVSTDFIAHKEDLLKESELSTRVKEGTLDYYSIEKRLLHKNGSEEWVSGIITAIRGIDGKPEYFLWQMRHVTERIKMIQRLKASEDLLHLFVEHSPAAIAMFDNEMRYIQVSRRWMTDYGLGNQMVIGKCHYEVFPTIGQDWKDIHQRCLTGAIERCEEDSFIREDGHTEWLRWEIHPWRREAGDIGGIIMMTEVITERQRMITDLVSRNKDLNEFANMVSHTLRGPLATIMGLANVLKENIAELEKDKIVKGIGESANRLDEVVREMNAILNTKYANGLAK